MKQIIQRLTSPTPDFFKKLGNIFLGIGAISAAVLTGGSSLPPTIISIAGYGLTAGAIGKVVSQLTTTQITEITESK